MNKLRSSYYPLEKSAWISLFGWVIFCLNLFTPLSLEAQRFPATASIQLTPPYSTNLEEYASLSSDRVLVTAVFNDFSVPSFDVRFKLTITSGNITIQSNPNAVYEPIRLIPGQLEQFSGFDLSEYFSLNNLVVSGIDQNDLLSGQGLPEGMYTFKLEIVDHRSGITISNEAAAMAPIFLNDPPQIIFPTCGATVTEIEPQNIQFQWLPMHLGSLNSAFSTEYELTLVEVPEGLNPEEAIRSALPTFETTVSANNFLYDVSAPLLENGKTYAYRIRARDIDNLGLFKNDGFSDVCWFKFGFNTEGEIQVRSPQNAAIVNGRQRINFSWDAPNNLDGRQAHRYEYKIVKLQEGDFPLDAIEAGPAFHKETFAETPSAFGWSFTLPVELDAESEYVWQVKAFSQDIEIAASNPQTITASPKISHLLAGSKKVEVISLDNEDFNNLSGKGRIQLKEDGTMYEVDFSGLKLKAVAGQLVLDDGEINFELPETFEDIVLSPDLDQNGEAIFKPSRVRLDKRRLEIFGHVEWDFHLPQKNGNPIVISSDSLWINYDAYRLNGPARLHANNRFELLEPFDFELNFDTESDFYISNNFYQQRFYGEVVMPEHVETSTGAEVVYEFRKWSQLFYNTINLELRNDPVSLTKNTNINLVARTAVLDFSFGESGGAHANEAEWLGLNYERYAIYYDEQVDATQLALPQSITHDFVQTTNADQQGWITTGGLQLEIDQRFSESGDGTAFFNEFGGSLKQIKLNIKDSEVSDGHVKGFIRIPVIAEDERFFYTLPVTSDGFEVGYLDEELEERYFSFNRYGGENKVDITIRRAVFTDNERLDLVVDIELPTLGVMMNGVEDFRIYGDFFIGFGKRNGSLPLSEQVIGKYDGFDLFIDEIGASFANASYAFSYSATLPLGEEFTGENGPPRITMHSVEQLSDVNKQLAGAQSVRPMPTDLPPPSTKKNTKPKVLTFDSLLVNANSPIVEFNGYLILTKDDPDWGTSFQGGVSGKLKIPATIGLGANLVLGDKEGTKFWYFDAWYVDETGVGINVFDIFSIVGLEGRIYSHMSIDGELPVKNGRPNLVVDPNLKFGAGLYLQMIDTRGGKLFMVDIGAEVLVKDKGFIVQMEGDLSMLNVEARTPGVGLALKKEVASKVAKEAAQKTVSALVKDIDVSVPIGDITFGLKANETGGGVSFEAGDASFAFLGDLSGTPTTSLNASLGSREVSLSADANSSTSFAIADGNSSVDLAVDGNQSGAFDFTYDALQVGANFDRQVNSTGFKVSYDNKLISMGANVSEGNGHLELAYDEGKRMYVEADKAGKGAFEFEIDGYKASLAANKEKGTGSFNYSDENNLFHTAIDAKRGRATLKLEVDQNLFDASIDKVGKGHLSFSNDNAFFNIQGDRTNGNGELEFIYNSDNRFYASLQNANEAILELERGTNRIAISGNRSQQSGQLILENTNGRLLAAANRSAGTGRFSLRYEQDSIYSALFPDSAIVALAFDNKQLAVAAKASGSGYLVLQDGERLLSVQADANEESGSMTLQNGSDRLLISANKAQRNGSLQWNLDGQALISSIDPNEALLQFESPDQSYRMRLATAGQAELGIQKGDFELGLVANTSTSTGELVLQTGAKRLKISSNRVLELTVAGTNVNFDPSTIGGPVSLSEAGVTIEVPLDDFGNGALDLDVGGSPVRFEITNGIASFSFIDGGNQFRLSVDQDGNGAIGYETGGTLYALRQRNETYELSAGNYQLAYSEAGSLTFSAGNAKSLTISQETLKLEYENQAIEFGTDKSLAYSNGQQAFSLGPDGVELRDGGRLVSLGADKSLLVQDGNKAFSYADNQLTANYENYTVSLDADKRLNFNDGVKSFDISSEAMMLSDGENVVRIVNQQGQKELSVAFGGRSVSLSSERFIMEEGNKTLTLGGESYFTYQTGPKRFLVAENQLLYEDGDKRLAYGGESFIELRDADRSMTVTTEKALEIRDGTKLVRLNPDRSALFEENNVQFTLGGGSVASFTDGSSTLALSSVGRSEYGISYQYDNYKLGLTTQKFKNAQIDIESPFVDLSLKGDANRNFTSSFIKDSYNVSLKGGRQGISVEGIESLLAPESIGGGPVGGPAEAEYLAGTEAPEMTGPLFIGKVTDGADGRIRGKAQFYYSSIDKHLIINGAVSSTFPPCLDGTIAIESRPDYWRVNIGSRERKIWVKPICTLFEGNGYLAMDSKSFEIGVGFLWNASGSIKIGNDALGARITAAAGAELGVEAAAQFQPVFALRRAGIWASAHANLDLEYWSAFNRGSVTLFSVDMSGNLTIEFEEKSRVYGEMEGRFEIASIIKKEFEVSFDKEF